ncbi:trimeric intracellular cation channel family protein [Caulobacter sp. KR2-114]|uniref:trimeric intracellular cation channel family protein n=1 Tax=Caulobacter sp. KR2-114 TaxID=3400912 RepID=UPI003C093423
MAQISLLTLPNVFSYAGVALFAATGAMAAARRKHDVVTFIFFAVITGLGGGALRDLLLGQPVFWVRDPVQLAVAACTGAVVWLVGFREKDQRLLNWPDAVGLSAFAVLGADKALALHVSPLVAILMGVLTATAGGIIRDITAGEPSVLLNREIYITAALVSAAGYVIGQPLIGADAASLVGFAAGAGLRVAAMLFGWTLPSYAGGVLASRDRSAR